MRDVKRWLAGHLMGDVEVIKADEYDRVVDELVKTSPSGHMALRVGRLKDELDQRNETLALALGAYGADVSCCYCFDDLVSRVNNELDQRNETIAAQAKVIAKLENHVVEFETTWGRVKCHDETHVWFPRYFGEGIISKIKGAKTRVRLYIDDAELEVAP